MATESAMVVHRDEPAQLAMAPAPLVFTEEQRTMIRNMYANGASEQEFGLLLEIAKARRLNPLLRQIHFVKRWDRSKNANVWSAQVSIDGLRAIAERTGKYDGQDEPKYELDGDGRPLECKVKVWRKDWKRPAVGIATWSEFVQTKDGQPTHFWKQMPKVMLAKCAEAQALRKAFPEDMSGLYVPEEMQGGRVEQQEESEPAPAPLESQLRQSVAEAESQTARSMPAIRSAIESADSEQSFKAAYVLLRDTRMRRDQRDELRSLWEERKEAWKAAQAGAKAAAEDAADPLPAWAGGPEDEECAAIQGEGGAA